MDRRCHALSLLLSDWEGCEIIEDNDLSLSTGGE
jgi:hypothetical protein